MAQSLSQILVHIIFSTKGREPYLQDPNLREELYRVIGGILNSIECQSLLVGGHVDHVHILCLLSRTRTASDLVKEVKRGSSIWLKNKMPQSNFAWQSGYGIFSISHSQIVATRRYITNQAIHHQKVSFQDEFRKFLDRYEVAFDELYVWD